MIWIQNYSIYLSILVRIPLYISSCLVVPVIPKYTLYVHDFLRDTPVSVIQKMPRMPRTRGADSMHPNEPFMTTGQSNRKLNIGVPHRCYQLSGSLSFNAFSPSPPPPISHTRSRYFSQSFHWTSNERFQDPNTFNNTILTSSWHNRYPSKPKSKIWVWMVLITQQKFRNKTSKKLDGRWNGWDGNIAAAEQSFKQFSSWASRNWQWWVIISV